MLLFQFFFKLLLNQTILILSVLGIFVFKFRPNFVNRGKSHRWHLALNDKNKNNVNNNSLQQPDLEKLKAQIVSLQKNYVLKIYKIYFRTQQKHK